MKKIFLSLSFAFVCLFAQSQITIDDSPAVAPAITSSQATSQLLGSFDRVDVTAPLEIRFVRVPESAPLRVIFDTKGSTTTRFKAQVREGELQISERPDSRRVERTSVTVEYHRLSAITLDRCTATFADPFQQTMIDLTLASATATMVLDVLDSSVTMTGKSMLTLSGKSRYFALYLSSGRLEAPQLETTSAQVSVSVGGVASLWITERLDAKTSTSGTLTYKGSPIIVRGGTKFMGGGIVNAQ